MNFNAAMQKAFAERNPQAAADLIGEATSSIDRQNRMDAAAEAGFVPEFMPYGIRVHLPR